MNAQLVVVEESTIDSLTMLKDGIEEISRQSFSIVVTSEKQTDVIEQAKEMKKTIYSLRKKAEEIKNHLKRPILDSSKVIDQTYKAIESQCKLAEEHLSNQANYIENKRKQETALEYNLRMGELKSICPEFDPDGDISKLNAEEFEALKLEAKDYKEFIEFKKERDKPKDEDLIIEMKGKIIEFLSQYNGGPKLSKFKAEIQKSVNKF